MSISALTPDQQARVDAHRKFLELVPEGVADGRAGEYLFDLVEQLVDAGLVDERQVLAAAQAVTETWEDQ